MEIWHTQHSMSMLRAHLYLYLSSMNRLHPTMSLSDGRLNAFGRLASQYMLALQENRLYLGFAWAISPRVL